MIKDHVRCALESFGVTPRSIQKPPDAKLAEVYIVDDRYVLRSRPYLDDTRTRYAAERKLLEFVAGLTGYAFPDYQSSRDGDCFFVDGRSFWTLHRLIPGQTLGKWFELHTVPQHVDQQVMTALRELHEAAIGRFDESRISRTRFLDMISPSLKEASAFLSKDSLQRIHASFKRVKVFSRRYPSGAACFVHGDFHHGNILVHEGKIVGFIDLDWCRVGNGFEDLGFTLMMLLRDYETWSSEFRWERYHDVLSFYRFEGDAALLGDYTALYALFDCYVFRAATFERSMKFYEYQKSFLETLCRTVVKGER
jgi:aminoglycoside phosphotransferase (APT) family kinase protein